MPEESRGLNYDPDEEFAWDCDNGWPLDIEYGDECGEDD